VASSVLVTDRPAWLHGEERRAGDGGTNGSEAVHALLREERDRLERLRSLVEDDEMTFDESAPERDPADA
jgi:hypothetical protein